MLFSRTPSCLVNEAPAQHGHNGCFNLKSTKAVVYFFFSLAFAVLSNSYCYCVCPVVNGSSAPLFAALAVDENRIVFLPPLSSVVV